MTGKAWKPGLALSSLELKKLRIDEARLKRIKKPG